MKTMYRRGQRGVALVVVLLLLLVITILGLASLRGTLLQERMSANTADRGRVFQVAEGALREAEQFASTRTGVPAAGCAGGVCGESTTGVPPWSAAGFWASGVTRAATAVVAGVTSSYILEYRGSGGLGAGGGGGSDCTTCGDVDAVQPAGNTVQYRITVRSVADTGAEVILQSAFEVPST